MNNIYRRCYELKLYLNLIEFSGTNTFMKELYFEFYKYNYISSVFVQD